MKNEKTNQTYCNSTACQKERRKKWQTNSRLIKTTKKTKPTRSQNMRKSVASKL